MSTFAHQQKLLPNQPELIPRTIKQKKRTIIRKRRNDRKKIPKFRLEDIFTLPHDIIDIIININTSVDAKIYQLTSLIKLRLINKETLTAVNDFCQIQCQKLNLHYETHSVKLYFNMMLYNDVKLLPDETICYNADIRCFTCNRNKNGLFINNRCAFKCRKYYCCNRNCEEFGEIYYITSFKFFPICHECKEKLVLHRKGSDAMACQRFNSFAPERSQCETPGLLARYACDRCRTDHMWNYDSDSDYDEY